MVKVTPTGTVTVESTVHGLSSIPKVVSVVKVPERVPWAKQEGAKPNKSVTETKRFFTRVF
jgi:hypothetical protein